MPVKRRSPMPIGIIVFLLVFILLTLISIQNQGRGPSAGEERTERVTDILQSNGYLD